MTENQSGGDIRRASSTSSRSLITLSLLIILLILLSIANVAHSLQPTGQPTGQPSRQPTSQPSRQPSNQPTCRPTRLPTAQPSRQPTRQPTRCARFVFNLTSLYFRIIYKYFIPAKLSLSIMSLSLSQTLPYTEHQSSICLSIDSTICSTYCTTVEAAFCTAFTHTNSPTFLRLEFSLEFLFVSLNITTLY